MSEEYQSSGWDDKEPMSTWHLDDAVGHWEWDCERFCYYNSDGELWPGEDVAVALDAALNPDSANPSRPSPVPTMGLSCELRPHPRARPHRGKFNIFMLEHSVLFMTLVTIVVFTVFFLIMGTLAVVTSPH